MGTDPAFLNFLDVKTRRLTNGMQPFSSLSLTSDAPSMALSNKQTCPKAPRVPTGTPTGTGTLIAVFFADDDDLDAVDMALLGADDVVAADPAVAVTAGTHVGILLLE